MSLTDRIIQLVELILLCLCFVGSAIYSMRVKNLERRLEAESAALKYEVKECEDS